MITLITFEHSNSSPVTRHNIPLQHAKNIGNNGGFYKVQIVNSFDQIEYEYK